MSWTLDQTSLIADAHNRVFSEQIEGWVGDRIWQFIAFADAYQRANGIAGDVAEIGIHHGKLFFLIASTCAAGQKAFALDLFDRQDLNVDRSGDGSRQIFESHLEKLFPELKDQCLIHAVDSMSITPATARNLLPTEGLRIFSVDGGHTVQHVIHDLSIAQEACVSGAFILLDDFLGPHWPGVTEGFFKFMTLYNTRLAPFLIFQNKLFITTYSEHADVLTKLRSWIENSFGDEIHRRWKYVTICGHSALAFS